jgi:hypothetical protein
MITNLASGVISGRESEVAGVAGVQEFQNGRPDRVGAHNSGGLTEREVGVPPEFLIPATPDPLALVRNPWGRERQ